MSVHTREPFALLPDPGAADPANLLASMGRPPARYLNQDGRDFFAVCVR
jgi:hypothetical protein